MHSAGLLKMATVVSILSRIRHQVLAHTFNLHCKISSIMNKEITNQRVKLIILSMIIKCVIIF